MSKRTVHERESDLDAVDDNEGRRNSKRFKSSPASPPAGNLLGQLVSRVLKNIEEIPPRLVIEGFADSSFELIVEEEFLIDPPIYNGALEVIGLQTNALTEAKEVEADYTSRIKQTIIMLNKLKDLLPAAHEAARKAREQADMPPPPPPMPVPSAYANQSVWTGAQEGPDAILCLRPHDKRGLPLITLHEAFLCFVNESKKPLPATETAALKAAFQLCKGMAEPFGEETSRRDAFNNELHPFISREEWSSEIVMDGGPGGSGGIDGALHRKGEPASYVLLREDKAELGAKGDPYMQISRGFQAFVTWKQSQSSDQGFPGTAKFLLTLAGPTLMISGGFYDGTSYIVEPLTPSMIMLPDYNMEGRPMVIAQCLSALKKAIDLIHIPPKQTIVVATPCIYSGVLSCDDPRTTTPISFVRRLPHLGPLMFLAKAGVGNNTEDCLVKLVYGHYGTEVHRLLATDGLAPRVLGTQTIEGAPTAVAMEYLQPYSAGSEGWATLFAFTKNIVNPEARKCLARAVAKIVETLQQANLVHGDLRLNNLMIHVNADGTVLDGEKVRVKVIDFDWGGKSGKVNHPMWRNEQINWPAPTGEAIVAGHDHALVKEWWNKTFPGQAYSPSDKP